MALAHWKKLTSRELFGNPMSSHIPGNILKLTSPTPPMGENLISGYIMATRRHCEPRPYWGVAITLDTELKGRHFAL